MKQFTVTEDHLKLLRRMYVHWDHCEFGAPCIDPKRPYGNSSVCSDIHEILTGERIGVVGSKRDELTDDEAERYEKLHQQTETVLQIVLSAGQFSAGTYLQTDYRTWTKKDAE